MSNFIPTSKLREQAESLRYVIACYKSELENPTHGFTGYKAQDANEMVERWLKSAEKRLIRVRRQLVINSRRERLAARTETHKGAKQPARSRRA